MSPVLTSIVGHHLSFAETNPHEWPQRNYLFMAFDGIISTKLLLWVQGISFPLSTFTLNGAFNKIETLMQSLMLRYACFCIECAENTKWQNNGPGASSQGEACALLWPGRWLWENASDRGWAYNWNSRDRPGVIRTWMDAFETGNGDQLQENTQTKVLRVLRNSTV